MSYQLVIAEKPSVAQSIANVLGARNKKDGHLEGNGYLVSWCVGHLVELCGADAYNEKYAKWNREDLPIVPAQWKYQVCSSKHKQFRILKELMNRKDVTELICATDAGREGELIFRQVYYHAGCKKPFMRLWISSMEDKAIVEGFRHLLPGSDYDTLYRSALARSQADWLVGINCTRLFTCLYGTMLRVGRVQTPVLAMICERFRQIEGFQKQPYWNIHLSCGSLTLHKEKIFDKAEAERLLSLCKGQPVTITAVMQEQKTIAPPRLYDLTTLQREANRYYGYTAQQTLDYTQSLYEKKYVTYPRTDSQYLTEDMASTARAMAGTVKTHFGLSSSVCPWNPDVKRIINNGKVSDHHAIIPTVEITNGHLRELSQGEQDILLLISQRLLAATAPHHIYLETRIAAVCADEEFTVKGKTVTEIGWKSVEVAFRRTLKSKDPAEGASADEVPAVTEGQHFTDVQVAMSTHFTTPPKLYTEDTLLSAMETAGNDQFDENTEKKGLGTPATRAGILEKLVSSGYVKRKGKSLIPTQEGINLISVMPENLKSPRMTAEWENTLLQIERGSVQDSEFLQGITKLVQNLICSYASVNQNVHRQFASSNKESIGFCPRCGSAVYDGKSSFYCSNRECSFCLWKNSIFLNNLKKPMTRKMATEFLQKGRVHGNNLYSARTGKTFDADIVLTETTDKDGKIIASFALEFPGLGKKAKP